MTAPRNAFPRPTEKTVNIYAVVAPTMTVILFMDVYRTLSLLQSTNN